VPVSGAAPQRDRQQGAPVALGDQKTVMLVAPQPRAQQALQQVSGSSRQQAHHPASPERQDAVQTPQPAAQDAAQAPPPSSQGPTPTLPEMAPAVPQDAEPTVPDDAEPVVPQDAAPVVPRDAEQDAEHPGSTARNGQQDPKERPAPRPRPRASSGANGQLDRDGSAVR
jgi:hypothetical protein